MAPFNANSFIDSINDPKTGVVEKQLSLLYLGMDLLDLNEKLQEGRSSKSLEKGIVASVKESKNQSYPWWKLW
jgi:hypothetical protein